MIRFVKGRFYPQADGTCVIENSSGIGFLMTIAANCPLYKHYEGEEVKAYTLMTVREDDISLFGFSSMDELDLFKLLISVSGVGAKAGISIMSILPVDELKRAIASGDSKTIATANGVGKKTAERVILELKDKVSALPLEGGDISGGLAPAAAPGSGERGEAVVALTTLGYSKKEAESAVASVPDEGLSAEEYVKKSLKFLL